MSCWEECRPYSPWKAASTGATPRLFGADQASPRKSGNRRLQARESGLRGRNLGHPLTLSGHWISEGSEWISVMARSSFRPCCGNWHLPSGEVETDKYQLVDQQTGTADENSQGAMVGVVREQLTGDGPSPTLLIGNLFCSVFDRVKLTKNTSRTTNNAKTRKRLIHTTIVAKTVNSKSAITLFHDQSVSACKPRFTLSRSSLPGLKWGTYLPSRLTASPVFGLRPTLGAR